MKIEKWTYDKGEKLKPIKRPGYKSLFGFCWMLWGLNRACKKSGVQVKFDITLPISRKNKGIVM